MAADKSIQQNPGEQAPAATPIPTPAAMSPAKGKTLEYKGTEVHRMTINGQEVCLVPGENVVLNDAEGVQVLELIAQGILSEPKKEG